MARSTHAPPGDRIFARVDRFDVECPNCGEIIRGQLSPRADNAFEHALVRAVTTAIKTGHLTVEQALSGEMPPAGKANIETLKAVYAEEGLDVPELDTPAPDLIAVGD